MGRGGRRFRLVAFGQLECLRRGPPAYDVSAYDVSAKTSRRLGTAWIGMAA